MTAALETAKSSWRGGAGGETLAEEEANHRTLALAVHRREEAAFEELVVTYERGLLDYARRLLGDVEDAQEVVQDAFVRAHRALTRQYDEPRLRDLLLRPWLFRITRNLARNKRRGKRWQVEEPLEPIKETGGAPATLAASAPLAEAEVEKRQELERLERALETLPEESRELVVLRFFEEMPYAEIAIALGASEAALRGRVFRALRLLRAALDPDHRTSGDQT
jgi:RNA polymerase sigma-70 factor (ECF subfamily)